MDKKKIYLYSSIFFIIDLLSKILIINFYKEKLTIINNFFYINKVTNTGAAFSIFSGYSIVFIVIGIIALIYIHKVLLKDIKSKIEKIAYAMLIGGIIGNLIDRIIYGKVIDFLSFKIFNYYFPIFNMADVFICISILLIAINLLIGGKNEISSKQK